MNAAKLKQKLLLAQKRVEKQRKIQAFLKQKAEKEDALFKEEMAALEEGEKTCPRRREAAKACKGTERKVNEMETEQLAELDNLLNA